MAEQDEHRSYEWLREKLAAMPPSSALEMRDLVWVDASRGLGVSRDPAGRIEIFIVGQQLQPRDRLVAENLEHQVWRAVSSGELAANRVTLPAAPHFDGVAALICTELVENGIERDRDGSFARCEPLIALALRRAGISDQAMLGLAGELSFMVALTSGGEDATAVVQAWAGSGPSTRDFQLGPVGVEVKTTTGTESEHHVQGFHQLELGTSVGGVPETHLFLLSLGVGWQSMDTTGWTVPALVEAMLGRLHDDDAATSFLDKVKQYGGEAPVGYDHLQHSASVRFRRPFHLTFERLYDLADDRLELLGSRDVQHASHVDPSSVNFRVRLPRRLRGDVNPVVGMPAVVSAVQRARA